MNRLPPFIYSEPINMMRWRPLKSVFFLYIQGKTLFSERFKGWLIIEDIAYFGLKLFCLIDRYHVEGTLFVSVCHICIYN